MEHVTTIRPKVSLYAGIGALAVSLIALIPALIAGSWASLPVLACTLLAIDVAVFVFFISPKIQFDDRGVIVTNPLRVFKADWAAILKFETKFGLTFVTESKKFVAWSAPAPSRREVRRITKHDLKGTSLENLEYIEPGLTHASESGSTFWQLEAVRLKNTAGTKAVKLSTNWIGVAGLVLVLVLGYVDLHL